MKIIALEAENVKKLRYVWLEPDGTLQVIGGRNAQGKSSVLDAVWLALGGGDASRNIGRPVRDGETTAKVMLDLGDIIVTRTWDTKGSKLKVTRSDHTEIKAPQGILDALVGKLSFDPLEFTRMNARAQRDTLLGLIDLPIDLDALDTARQQAFDERTQIGRDEKALGEIPKVEKGAPTEEASPSELIAKIREIEAANYQITQTAAYHESAVERAKSLKETIAQLTADLAQQEQDVTRLAAEVATAGNPKSTAELEAQLADLETHNVTARANSTALAKAAEAKALRKAYDTKTMEIQKIDADKAAALATAVMPVPGLGITSEGLTYQGVPLSQASSAEQIRVSLAMGMALNPRLKMLMIHDGSLLDTDSMTAIHTQATEHGYQILVERVGDGDEGAIILEDGEIVQ